MNDHTLDTLVTEDGFRKSKRSMNSSNCVECRVHGAENAMRDTKNRHLGHLTFGEHEWTAFLNANHDA